MNSRVLFSHVIETVPHVPSDGYHPEPIRTDWELLTLEFIERPAWDSRRLDGTRKPEIGDETSCESCGTGRSRRARTSVPPDLWSRKGQRYRGVGWPALSTLPESRSYRNINLFPNCARVTSYFPLGRYEIDNASPAVCWSAYPLSRTSTIPTDSASCVRRGSTASC